MVKGQQKLQLYKSGFLGLGTGLQLPSSPSVKLMTVNNMMYQLSTHQDPSKDLVSSERIIELGSTLLNTYTGILNFDRRHAFLEEVLSILPTANFAQWCLIQADSPLFSELHRDFLEDTVRYAKEGRRRMNIHNWTSLFHHAQPQVRAKRVKFSPWFVEELKTNYSGYRFSEFYSNWLGNKDGMMDFVKTFVMAYGQP